MLLERGAGRAVLTLGSKGSVIGTQENPMPKHIPVTAAEPVDTTVSLIRGFFADTTWDQALPLSLITQGKRA